MSQAISFRRKDHANQPPMGGSGSFKANNDLAISPRWRSSPMSFKMGSWVGSLGTRQYGAPGCSPTPALDIQDFKMGSVSSSFDHGRFLQALSSSHANDDGCSNYTCCGLPLNDLHALLDHFEESHVYVLDHHALAPAPTANPTSTASAPVVPTAVPGHFDDMTLGGMDMDPHHLHQQTTDIELDSTDSPLGSGSSTASSQNSSPTMGSQAALTNGAMYPYYADLRNLMAAGGPAADTMPPPPAPSSNLSTQLQQCIPPSLLFSPAGSPGSSRPQSSAGPATPAEPTSDSAIPQTPTAKPIPAKIKTTPEALAEAIDETLVVSGPDIIHPGPPPPTQAPTSLSKPFKCPTAHCNKAYKQANGLKYHLTHGQCCFLPKDPALEGLDELEKDKVERPFGCGVGGCERRYKNMNGLRYHYQHSGAHGAVGLALLAAGTHSVQIAAHNAAVGRNSAKAAARAASQAASTTSSTMSSPTSPTGHSHSRSSSISSTGTIKSPISGTGPRPVSSGVRPGQPNAPTYAQSTYYSTLQQQQQQPGYPYAPGYPYVPQPQQAGGAAVRPPGAGPVFPPSMTATIASMAGPLGPPFNYQQQVSAAVAQRPQHQLLRQNSQGRVEPVVATSTVTATSGGSPHGVEMEVAAVDGDGDCQMGE